MTLPEDLSQFLRALNAEQVEFLVVGAYAVGVYSEPRATGDLDLFVRSTAANCAALFRALAIYGVRLPEITPNKCCDDRDSVLRIGENPARIDLVTAIDGVEFEEAWPHSVELSVDGIALRLISAEHLIQSKLKSGRLQDLADVEAIREADRAAPEKHE